MTEDELIQHARARGYVDIILHYAPRSLMGSRGAGFAFEGKRGKALVREGAVWNTPADLLAARQSIADAL